MSPQNFSYFRISILVLKGEYPFGNPPWCNQNQNDNETKPILFLA